MEKKVTSVIKYFSLFAYKPTLEEVYTFLPIKISKKQLKYTPPQYSIGRKISKRKLQNWRYRSYIKLFSLFPQIKLVGLSGSISMMNAKEDDDIDLFIITAKNRLFTGRFIALVLAQLLGLRRQRQLKKLDTVSSKNKICLNLFFDESNLKAPKFKQTEFVGHEVLQMKPIIVKGNVYERFLEANKWVFKLFPNAINNSEFKIHNSKLKNKILNSKLIHNSKFIILNFGGIIESMLKNFQLRLINRHRTTELISNSQLWFHPDDFEKKIKKLKG